MRYAGIGIASLFLCSWLVSGKCQDYFHVYDDQISLSEIKIQRFANQDILLATSSLASLRNGGKDARLFCQRLDYCGNLLWSYAYRVPEDHVLLADAGILSSGDIVLYGSIYKGLRESIFLMRVNGATGVNEEMRIFNPGTVDHFTYSLDVQEDAVMVYGLLLDFNTRKTGFVAQFSSKLSFQWAKKFTPFESSGRAVITPAKNIAGFSGNFVFQLGRDGTPDWYYELSGNMPIKIIGGPLLVPDGSIYELREDTINRLLKIKHDGRIDWLSKPYRGSAFPSALENGDAGKLLVTSLATSIGESSCIRYTFTSAGKEEQAAMLLLPRKLTAAHIQQNVGKGARSTLSGTSAAFSAPSPGEIQTFVLQFPLDESPAECLAEKKLTSLPERFFTPTLKPIQHTSTAFSLALENTFRPDTVTWKRSYTTDCAAAKVEVPRKRDTLLGCRDKWQVSLPGSDYVWADNYPNPERTLEIPGIYKAYRLSCTQAFTQVFQLRKENCGCPVFIPDAFSPNGDGINDVLTWYSPCSLLENSWEIYSRWGDLLHKGTDLTWTGDRSGKPLPQDTYILHLRYKIRDLNGNTLEETAIQGLHLVR